MARLPYESARHLAVLDKPKQPGIRVGYNYGVARPAASGGPKKNPGAPSAPHKWRENIGLILVAILILVIAITRYFHNIHWSTR